MASVGYMRPSVMAQVFPSAPKFTEANLPDLAGKVYIITGANAGVGKELARILFEKNASVYMACRSEAKCQAAIDEIKKSAKSETGRLEYIHIDLGDLASVKPAAESFLARETQLHALFNNAGVMLPPASQTATVQGYDVQLGTNSVAPFLLTQLLTPVLKSTASATKEPTRVVWVSSMAAELYSEKYGIDMSNLRGKTYVRAASDPMTLYGNSKAAAYLHSVEYARRHRDDNIISVAANPGNLDSDLYRTVGGPGQGKEASAPADQDAGLGFVQKMSMKVFRRFMLHPPVYGAYTELFSGLSPEVTLEKSGAWVGPWGRFFPMRKDVAENAKPKSEGGLGGAEAFWDWSVEQVKPFM
ncbi:short-chain dehydrogenase [Ophiostoma piceae UAMH 11346]|uniref:Short-chain dehydrogenase n=1 Tax=Ophiostoma piceae (strain UAMH 11346) TaxID=1262450 RepID=S3C909_OPHP1|nr:short-chain dehydrogenase [Ophiostoma piceae UAMH 11346]